MQPGWSAFESDEYQTPSDEYQTPYFEYSSAAMTRAPEYQTPYFEYVGGRLAPKTRPRANPRH